MTYEIGYRRPPASGKCKKGASGNHKGRPKGSRNFVTLLEKELAQTVTVNENGKKMKVTRLQAMVKRIVASALSGDAKSTLHLIDILRRTGQLDGPAAEDALPPDYEALLDTFIAQRSSRKPSSSS